MKKEPNLISENFKAIGQSNLKTLIWSLYISISFGSGFFFVLFQSGRIIDDQYLVAIATLFLFISLLLIFKSMAKLPEASVEKLSTEEALELRKKGLKKIAFIVLITIPISYFANIGLLFSILFVVYFFGHVYLFIGAKWEKTYLLIGLVVILIINLLVFENWRSVFFSLKFIGGVGAFVLSFIILRIQVTKSRAFENKNASVNNN